MLDSMLTLEIALASLVCLLLMILLTVHCCWKSHELPTVEGARFTEQQQCTTVLEVELESESLPRSTITRVESAMDHHLTADNIQEVRMKVWPARAKWYDIGIELGLPVGDLDAIERKNNHNPDECITDMLILWLRQSTATWETLIAALRQKTVGFGDLANSVVTLKTTYPRIDSSNTESPPERLFDDNKAQQLGCTSCVCDYCLNESSSSNPLLTDATFPLLDIGADLTDVNKQDLQTRLRKESQQIMREFIHLLLGFFNSLETRQIPLLTIKRSLMYLEAYRDVNGHPQSVFAEQEEKVNKATNLNELLDVVKKFCSFFNYGLVEDLITELGSTEDKKQIEEYKANFVIYANRRIGECPSNIGVRDASQSNNIMLMKLDSRFHEYTLNQLREFCLDVSKILEIYPRAIRPCCIEKGCIRLTFQISRFVQVVVFPLSCEQETSLKKLCVTNLTCGSYSHSFQAGEDRSIVTKNEIDRYAQ